MFSFFVFILAGVAIATLTVAKRFEIKSSAERRIFILRAVSRGDERARDLYHKSLRFYSEGKIKAVFFFKKQLPVRIKIYTNKSVAWFQARFEERFGDVRGSRFIKREGISEFFKNISEIEKGKGELHEEVYAEPEEILAYRITPVAAESLSEPVVEEESVSAPAPEAAPEPVVLSITEESVTLSRPKKPRAPRKKKGIEEAVSEPALEPVLVSVPKPKKPRVKKVPVVEVSEY